MITTVCKISYGSQTVPPIVPAVQGDTGRAISFEIADFTPPAGATATYFILKPSGEAIYNSATITDNSILCELTAQSLAEAGENRMQVRVLQGEDIVTSFEVILMVRTFLGDDAIESGTEMNIFDQAVEQATEQFQENTEQIVEEVIESIPADYTALTEEVDELNERLSHKIDVQQDVENTGKALIVGNDGTVSPDSIFNQRIRTAFANIFQRVAYTAEDAKDYYDELLEALAGNVKVLTSISATYISTGHTVYPYTQLNKLKNYLSVIATYNDGTSAPITDYELSGNLDSASSEITITYLSKSTTVNVSVSIDSSLAYYLTQDINLDGQSGVDTNYRTSDSDKALTIIGDFTDQDTATWSGTMTSSLARVNGTATGFYAYRSASTVDGVRLTSYAINARGSLSAKSSNLIGESHRVKFAISHPANSRMIYFTLYVDGQMHVENQGNEGVEFVASTQTLIIGARPEGDRCFKGICHMCNIYNRQLSISEIKSVLEVS